MPRRVRNHDVTPGIDGERPLVGTKHRPVALDLLAGDEACDAHDVERDLSVQRARTLVGEGLPLVFRAQRVRGDGLKEDARIRVAALALVAVGQPEARSNPGVDGGARLEVPACLAVLPAL